MYLKLGTLTLAVLVSFIPGTVASATVYGSYLSNDSFWWTPTQRTATIVQLAVSADKASMAELERESYRTVRKVGGHSFHLDTFVLGDNIFDKALNYIGTPYSYSGVGPSYFDCSGFTMFIVGKYGINLEHSASTQLYQGRVIPRSQARYGDLVWMPGHIGFWAGDGLILDALKPGTRVDVRKIWTSYYKIVRVADVDRAVE